MFPHHHSSASRSSSGGWQQRRGAQRAALEAEAKRKEQLFQDAMQVGGGAAVVGVHAAVGKHADQC
jgi:hypothetical protein